MESSYSIEIAPNLKFSSFALHAFYLLFYVLIPKQFSDDCWCLRNSDAQSHIFALWLILNLISMQFDSITCNERSVEETLISNKDNKRHTAVPSQKLSWVQIQVNTEAKTNNWLSGFGLLKSDLSFIQILYELCKTKQQDQFLHEHKPFDIYLSPSAGRCGNLLNQQLRSVETGGVRQPRQQT